MTFFIFYFIFSLFLIIFRFSFLFLVCLGDFIEFKFYYMLILSFILRKVKDVGRRFSRRIEMLIN